MAKDRRVLMSFPKNGSSRNSGASQGTCWTILGRLNCCQNILAPRTVRLLQKSSFQVRQNAVVIPITHKGIYAAESKVKNQSLTTITKKKDNYMKSPIKSKLL